MRAKILTIVAMVLVAGSSAAVQAQQRKGQGADQTNKQVRGLSGQKESLVEEDVSTLTGQQKLERAETKISESRDNLDETNALLEKARKQEKDIMKINCINDKQAAIKGFLKVAEQSYVKLKNAVSDNDTEESSHHYTLISVSKQKIDSLTQEARMCAGEVQRYAEETQVEVDVDGDIADPEAGYIPPEPTRLTDLPELSPVQ